MPRTVVSSWRHDEGGTLEHSDYKVCIHDEDNTYEVETSRTDMGIELGSSRDGKNTVITRIFDGDKYVRTILFPIYNSLFAALFLIGLSKK